MTIITEIHQPAARKEAQYRCSECGEDRFCNCAAPAIEKLAAKVESDRQRAKAYRARKAEEKQSERHVTHDPEAEAEAMTAAHAAAEVAEAACDIKHPCKPAFSGKAAVQHILNMIWALSDRDRKSVFSTLAEKYPADLKVVA